MRNLILAVCTLALCTGAQAQQFPIPGRTIRIIVPFSPGGATDVQARAIAQKVSASLGNPVIVENKPGGMPPAEFARLVRELYDRWGVVIRTVGVKLDQ